MKRLAICALSLAIWAYAAAAYAAEQSDPMDDVSPGALLRADQFDKLEEYYDHYLKQYDPKVVNSYIPVWAAFNNIGYTEDLLPHYNKWVAAKPKSYAALLMRGSYYRQYAWTARGAGFINTVTEKGYDLFTQRLLLANTDVTSASLLNPAVPFHFSEMLQLDMGLQRGRLASFSHLMQARKIDPSFYPAHMIYMWMNRPRWGGSPEILKKFAQDYADSVPGSLLPLLWTEYHDEMSNTMNEGPTWWTKPGNWEQVDAIFKKLIEINPEPKKTGLRCTYVSFASRANKPDVLREQLELIGPNWKGGGYNGVDYGLFYIQRAWPKQNANEWLIGRATAALKDKPRSADLYFARGVAEKANKQYEAALGDLRTALQLDPDLTDAWVRIASACDQTSRTQEAIDAADRCLLCEPSDEQALLIKGKNLQKLGQTDAVEKMYRDSLKIHPSLNRVSWSYGSILLNAKRYADVVEVVDKAERFLDADKDHDATFILLRMRAQAKIEMNNPEAVEEYGELLKIEDNESDAEAALGKMVLSGGVWEPYQTRIQELIDKNCKGKDEADRKRRLNIFHLGANNAADAVALAETLTQQSPNDPKVRHQLAKAYLTSKRYAESMKIYQKLCAENPNDLDAFLGVGRCQFESGDLDGAIATGKEFYQKYETKATQEQKTLAANILGHALDAKQKKAGRQPNVMPRRPNGSMSLSSEKLRKLTKQPEEALILVVDGIEANPTSSDSYSDFLFFSRFGMKTYVPASLQIQHVIELAEKRNGPQETELQTQCFESNKKSALQFLQRIRQTQENKPLDAGANLKAPGAHYAIARILLLPDFKGADPARALKEAEEGARLGDNPIRAQEYIMVAHERMGNLTESLKVAQEILKKDPKSACARLQIMWLDRVKGIK